MGDLERLPVGIIGASGYGGVQLVRLLIDHPGVEVVYLGGDNSAGKHFSDIYPHLGHRVALMVKSIDLEEIATRCKAVQICCSTGSNRPVQ